MKPQPPVTTCFMAEGRSPRAERALLDCWLSRCCGYWCPCYDTSQIEARPPTILDPRPVLIPAATLTREAPLGQAQGGRVDARSR